MTTDQLTHTKRIVDAFIQELFTEGDLDAVGRYLDPGFVDHDPPVPGVAGAEGMHRAAAMFRQAFPDWRSEVTRLVAEGDIVVEQFTAQGTHRGALTGAEPTGRTVVLAGHQRVPRPRRPDRRAVGSARRGRFAATARVDPRRDPEPRRSRSARLTFSGPP